MSKATLTFDLPDDYEDFISAIYGPDYRYALQHLDRRLRDVAKYEQIETLSVEEIREWFREERESLPE